MTHPVDTTSPSGTATSHGVPSTNIDVHREKPNFWEDLKKVYPSDLLNVLQIPCSRTAFLYGLVGGLGVGFLHFGIRGKFLLKQSTILASCHRAVGGFVFVSLVTWEKCRYDRARAENNVRLVTQQLKRLSEAKAKQEQSAETPLEDNSIKSE